MNEFHVDKQFGVAIFIDVTKGIVQQCKNGNERMITKMNELYVGKSISFLKEDFEAKMKGCYYNVRSTEVNHHRLNISSIDAKLVGLQANIQRATHQNDIELKKKLEERILEVMIQKEDAIKLFEAEKEKVFNEHNFNAQNVTYSF